MPTISDIFTDIFAQEWTTYFKTLNPMKPNQGIQLSNLLNNGLTLLPPADMPMPNIQLF